MKTLSNENCPGSGFSLGQFCISLRWPGRPLLGSEKALEAKVHSKTA
jgi:hypothetical protein